MKLFILTVAVLFFTACKKEAEEVLPERPVQILTAHSWTLADITTKMGTLDPFEEVSPNKITVITEGCEFGAIVQFLEPNTYQVEGDSSNCLWGNGDNVFWEIRDNNNLRFRGNSFGFGYMILVLNHAEMILSVGGDPVHGGGESRVEIRRFKAL